VKDGDLFIAALGADGENVALPVQTAAKAGDLLIPVLCADGVKAAVAVSTLAKDGDIGVPVLCSDDNKAAVSFGKMPEYWFYVYALSPAGPMLAYDLSLKKGVLPSVGGATHPYAWQLHSGIFLKNIVSMESQITRELTNPCAIDGYFYVVSQSSLADPQPIRVRCYDDAGSLVFESSLNSWTWYWSIGITSYSYGGGEIRKPVRCHPISASPDRYLVFFHDRYVDGYDIIRTVVDGNSGALISQTQLVSGNQLSRPVSAPAGDNSFWVVSQHYNGSAWEIWRGRYTKDSVVEAYSLWISAPVDPHDNWRYLVGMIECGDYMVVGVNFYDYSLNKYFTIYYRFDKATGLNRIELCSVEILLSTYMPYILRLGTSSRLYMERYESSGSKWVLCWMDLATGTVTDVTDGTDAFLLGEWDGKGLVATEHGPAFTPPNQPMPLKYFDLATGEFE
jgi:hypothetical protein